MELLKTRKEQYAALEAAGVCGEAAEFSDRLLGGPEHRHASRVAATLEVVKASPFGGMLLAADLVGVGGTMGVTGEATARVPAFSGLGTGRKQARDGGAWNAAAEEAMSRLLALRSIESEGILVGWDADEEGLSFCYVAEGGKFIDVRMADVDEGILPPMWRKAVAARGLAAVLRAGEGPAAMDDGHWTPVDGTAAHWAAALNALLETERIRLQEENARRAAAEAAPDCPSCGPGTKMVPGGPAWSCPDCGSTRNPDLSFD